MEVALTLLVSLFKKLLWECILNLFPLKIINSWMKFYVSRPLSALSGKSVYISCFHLHLLLCILKRFGSKSYRIFRLLLMKRSLEQKQVQCNGVTMANTSF